MSGELHFAPPMLVVDHAHNARAHASDMGIMLCTHVDRVEAHERERMRPHLRLGFAHAT